MSLVKLTFNDVINVKITFDVDIYKSYGEDVYILNILFNYKIKEVNGIKCVGFPVNSYDKVIGKLKKFKVNFVIAEGDEVENIYRYGKYLFHIFLFWAWITRQV